MHVAIVCERLTLHDDVAEQARLLAGQYAEMGHRVTLLTAVGLDAAQREGVEVRVFNRRWWRFAPGLVVFRRWLRSNLVSLKPDRTIALTTLLPADAVVPTSGTAAAYAGALRAMSGPPPVRVGAWVRSVCPAQWLRQVWEHQALSSVSTRVIVADNDTVESQLRTIKGLALARLKRVDPAVSASPVDFDAAGHLRRQLARGLGLDDGAAWLVFPFQSAWLDGFEPLMLAFKSLIDRGSDASLLLAGPWRYTHLAWVAQLGLRGRVRFLGRPDHPDQLLAAADLLVQPTQHDPGGAWPLAALAMGLPVLTTDASGAADAIGPDTGGVLVAPVDPTRLAESLAEAVESAIQARQGGSGLAPPLTFDADPSTRARAILALSDAESPVDEATPDGPA